MIGRHVSHFYIIRSLGSGGMGMVYEAQDTRLPRSVAIKFLKPSLSKNVDAVRRFKREARLASTLNHPNICTILDVDQGDGQFFIAMELLRGRPLREQIGQRAFATAEILDLAIQVADALGTAHDLGIMHRDITPGNIFLTAGGGVKLLDFGLAKQFAAFDGDGTLTDAVTEAGTVAGTIHYMAPEQFTPQAAVDHRCDLFSLGAVLYQMATGAKPFEAKAKSDVIALIQEHPHTPVRQLAPQQSPQLARIIDTLLAKDPARRYKSAWALRAELELARANLSPATGRPPAEGDATVAVAVLPFELLGPATPFTVHLRDGIAEEIAARLSELPYTRVAPRTSSRVAAGGSLREVAQALNVQLVIEGAVQQTERRVRVSAGLYHAISEQPLLPAIRVDRTPGDVLDLQEEIGRSLVDAMATPIRQAAGRQYTQDAEAYSAFRRGQYHWKECFSGGWRPALEQFQYAVERDSRFALAHLALAAVYNFLGFYCHMKPLAAFGVARSYAEQALEIDNTLAAAHAELALATFGGDWDWESAEAAFRRALRLDPANPLSHVYYSWLLVLLGRHDAALAEAEMGQSLGSASRLVVGGLAQTLYLARRYDEAIAACERCLALDEHYAFAVHLRGQCAQMKGDHDRAIVDFERAATLSGRSPFYLGILGHCYGECHRRADAVRLLDELQALRAAQQVYVPPQCFVYIHAGLGERDQALAYQEEAYRDGASPFNYLSPNIRELYALEPTHKKRLEQMRLAV